MESESENLVQGWVRDFLEHLEIEKNYSQLTLLTYGKLLHRFTGWLNERQLVTKDAAELDLETIRQYRLYLARLRTDQGKPLKKVTQAYHVIALRSLLRFLITQKRLPVLAPELVELPKFSQRSVNFLTIEQMEDLLKMPDVVSISGLRDRAMMETLFSTGLRVSELVSLNREYVNLDRKEFGVVGKGGKARVVFLSSPAVFWLSQYLGKRTDEHHPLFISHSERGKQSLDCRLTARSVERLVRAYGQRAHLPFEIKPHTLRHSFATDLLFAGADIRSVQEMLGHASIRTTQVYTHVTDRQLRDVYRAFHGHSRSTSSDQKRGE
ncbi:MAG: tyrosine-type recombinase/integrase [bacterium]